MKKCCIVVNPRLYLPTTHVHFFLYCFYRVWFWQGNLFTINILEHRAYTPLVKLHLIKNGPHQSVIVIQKLNVSHINVNCSHKKKKTEKNCSFVWNDKIFSLGDIMYKFCEQSMGVTLFEELLRKSLIYLFKPFTAQSSYMRKFLYLT